MWAPDTTMALASIVYDWRVHDIGLLILHSKRLEGELSAMLDPPQRFDQFAEHLDYVPSAATARLEDVAHHSSTSQTPSHNTASSASTGVAAMPSQSSSNTASAPAELAESPAQKAYQSDVIDGALQDYVTKSKEIGGPVSEHVSHDQFWTTRKLFTQ
jgi:hypothetical protein